MNFDTHLLKNGVLALTAVFTLAACSQTAPLLDSDSSSLDLQSDQISIRSSLGWEGTTRAADPHTKVLRSAIENKDFTLVALPLYQGISQGKPFWFVVTEASKAAPATAWGVNLSPQLENAKGTAAVQKGRVWRGRLEVPATVDFSPTRSVVPGPTAFPPTSFTPGSVGQAGYSPLVSLPDGTVLNASHVANSSGVSDKVVSINYKYRYVVLNISEGFYEDHEIYYVSLDSSGDFAASLEAVTLASNLNAAPGIDSNDVATSARSGIGIFTNGQTGATNPNRQGLTSALLGEGGPLNVTQTFPQDEMGKPEADYSPLWDAHVSTWTPTAIDGALNTAKMDFEDVSALGAAGTITAPDGSVWGASGFIVNCPVISIDR